MRSKFAVLLLPVFFLATFSAHAVEPTKEWTFLVFLNGKNNLDRFGNMDINEMEKVGSNKDLNIVVEWGSLANKTTKRMLIAKDNDPTKVTSPTLQDMGKVDMGDFKSLVDFVKWGVANYPAKHYFIDVWDHGAGWHFAGARGVNGTILTPADISWDDETGNFITTENLGLALRQSAAIIGHKVDVYGSDACLMAMPEVAAEMGDAVDVYVGSEETEPAEGWPYDAILSQLKAGTTPQQVGKIMVQEYVKSYQGGSQGSSQVTLSAFDMSKLPKLADAVKTLGIKLQSIGTADRQKVVQAIGTTLNFTYSDYADLSDFLKQLELAKIPGLTRDVFTPVSTALADFVVANGFTSDFSRAGGVALWIPDSKYTFDRYSARYNGLEFTKSTDWGSALKYILAETN
jgi:hypothetical protein